VPHMEAFRDARNSTSAWTRCIGNYSAFMWLTEAPNVNYNRLVSARAAIRGIPEFLHIRL
jgi:hypothetical protein